MSTHLLNKCGVVSNFVGIFEHITKRWSQQAGREETPDRI
jgi:hypothetical protein